MNAIQNLNCQYHHEKSTVKFLQFYLICFNHKADIA